MADAAPSPLTFRDFLYYTLPTAVAICLFTPLYAPLRDKISIESLILSAVVLGYLISTPMIEFVSGLYEELPVIKDYMGRYKDKADWSAGNWNYDRLFYLLTNEEREYIYLTRSYADFYRLISFYLLLYSVINLYMLGRAAWNVRAEIHKIWPAVVSATTPLPKDAVMPTWVLFIASAILSYYALREFFNEYSILFHEGGQYVNFAERYQTKNDGGKIAVSIWGKVQHNNQALEGSEVELIGNENRSLGTVTTNADGHFQFLDKYAECIDVVCKLKVRSGGEEYTHPDIKPEAHKVPYYVIEFPNPPAASPSLPSPQRNLRIRGALCCGVLIVLFLVLLYFEANPYLRAAYIVSAIVMIPCPISYMAGPFELIKLTNVMATLTIFGMAALTWSTTILRIGILTSVIFVILTRRIGKS